eukprot:3474436-Rhodomonas_salina.1
MLSPSLSLPLSLSPSYPPSFPGLHLIWWSPLQNKNRTPLAIAANGGLEEVVKEHGAPAGEKVVEIVKLLLGAGAVKTTEDVNGDTALMRAQKSDLFKDEATRAKVVQLLQ